MQFEYPLQWPQQQKRTKYPQRSRFGNVSIARASDELFNELRLLGGSNIVISTNLQQKMRGDGFYSNQIVNDTGIAIYLTIKGQAKVMACDKWDKVEHNIWALSLSVKAIRGLERWGGSEFLDGLFTGFTALPAAGATMQTTSYFDGIQTVEALKIRYHELARKYHPDHGGDVEQFKAMKVQYEQLVSSLTN